MNSIGPFGPRGPEALWAHSVSGTPGSKSPTNTRLFLDLEAPKPCEFAGRLDLQGQAPSGGPKLPKAAVGSYGSARRRWIWGEMCWSLRLFCPRDWNHRSRDSKSRDSDPKTVLVHNSAPKASRRLSIRTSTTRSARRSRFRPRNRPTSPRTLEILRTPPKSRGFRTNRG